MKKTIFIVATLIIALLALFQLSKFSIMQGSSSLEFIIAAIAIIFFLAGIFINKKRSHLQEKPKTTAIDHAQIETLGLSKREYEVFNFKLSIV